MKSSAGHPRTRTSVFITGLICMIVCTGSGCFLKPDSRKKQSDQAAEKRVTIGFSIDTFIIERWRRDCDIFRDTARALGADVIVQNAGNDQEAQCSQIQYLIDRGVDVLVIVPKNADALTAVVQRARSKGIPVVSYDRLIRNADVSLYLTIDSRQVGFLMAEALLRLRPKGAFYCIYGAEEDYNMALIDTGVRDALDGRPVSVQFKYYTTDWNYDLSYRKMSELLELNLIPDAVICGNDAVAESVLKALSEHRLGTTVPVVGQDADIAACQRIAAGTQAATVYKPITELAQKAATYAYLLASGVPAAELDGVTESIDNGAKRVPAVFLAPVLVTSGNIDDVIVDSGFHSREDVYRNGK